MDIFVRLVPQSDSVLVCYRRVLTVNDVVNLAIPLDPNVAGQANREESDIDNLFSHLTITSSSSNISKFFMHMFMIIRAHVVIKHM